jgi:hypothetical protein
MRTAVVVTAVLMSLSLPLLSLAQRDKRDPLTPVEIEKIREAGIYPTDRVKLYTEFVDEHVKEIKDLAARPHSAARAKKLDDSLQDLAALTDEFGSNLDVYDDRKADVRKALAKLNEDTPHWTETLRNLKSEPGFDLSRTDATESMKDLSDQAAQMLKDQTKYFEEHKDQAGQDRYEPAPR